MNRTGRLGQWPRRCVDYSIGEPPALAEVRRIARGQGYALRSSRKGSPGYWLVTMDGERVVTPRLELLQIWHASGSTVVFVTHSISEAVFLSTRVVVMSPRPGRIAGVVEIDLPQPRTIDTREEPRFFELVTEVRELLRGKHGEETR